MTDDDMILWLLRRWVDRVAAKAGTVDTVEVLKLEQEARNHWGGSRPYIAKSPSLAKPSARGSHGGVPRRTYYRWVAGRRG